MYAFCRIGIIQEQQIGNLSFEGDLIHGDIEIKYRRFAMQAYRRYQQAKRSD